MRFAMRVTTRTVIVLVGLLALGLSVGRPQGVVPVHGDMPKDIYATPATLELIPKAAGAHPGKVWIRASDEGLDIWGKVQVADGDLHWPQEKSEMLASDHVEIWLASAADVQLPPVGYGNQFGEENYAGIKDCAQQGDSRLGDKTSALKNCERWFNEQTEYRKQFVRLFARQWLTAGGGYEQHKHVFEDYAAAAYESLRSGFFADELPEGLRPREDDKVISEINEESSKQETRKDGAGNPYLFNVTTGYNFHFFIPYSAFPPAQQLDLRDLRVMVDVFGAAPEGKKMGSMSTTSAQRVWGRPATFNHLLLDEPRRHSITPCGAAPIETDLEGDTNPAWYLPMAGQGPRYLSTVYAIENPAAGYMYDPGGVSPMFVAYKHFWKQTPDGASVCGPELAYRTGAVVKTSNFRVEEKYFQTKALPDGWTLVRTGPDMSTQSRFASGQCGACSVVDFHLYAVSPAGEIGAALDINDEFAGYEGQASAGDLAISPDWKRVTFYEDVVSYDHPSKETVKEVNSWSATSYCLEGHAYKECGKQAPAKPPSPANFPEIGDN